MVWSGTKAFSSSKWNGTRKAFYRASANSTFPWVLFIEKLKSNERDCVLPQKGRFIASENAVFWVVVRVNESFLFVAKHATSYVVLGQTHTAARFSCLTTLCRRNKFCGALNVAETVFAPSVIAVRV